ncbi:putative Ig domain-containing protein [Shewanella sp. 10N.261.52.F9]|uniref:putative Ig domain-containing protein n=1 Tax=Shewanella sp. 10N.261.52.F9 TaxID=3229684 RepID=UPI00354C5E9C
MKKLSILAASIGIILAGCGSSDDDSVKTFEVKAIDGYLVNADIYAGEKCDTKVGLTNEQGIAKVDNKYQEQTICVKAVAGTTLDSDRGIVAKDFELAAPANSSVINPMTNLVVEKMQANNVTAEDAKAEVAEQFAALNAKPEQLFGDYIKDANAGDQLSQGIKVIAETLVDAQVENTNVTDSILDDLVSDVADKVENKDDLEDYAPVIDNDGFTPNHRPQTTLTEEQQDKLEEISVSLGQAITPIELLTAFSDKDSDELTISVKSEDGKTLAKLGLAFDQVTGVLSGTPINAGEIELHVYATDSKGARSYPLEIEIEVTSPNTAPTIDNEEKAEIEAELKELNITQGSEINAVIDLDDLFTDTDEDTLKLVATTDMQGVTLNIEQEDDLRLTGKSELAGDFTISVTANDGVNAAVKADLKVSVANNDITPEPDLHPLEANTWYALEYGSDDGTDNVNQFTRVWCETYKFEDGKVFMNARSLNNLTECSEDASEQVGTYTVTGDKLETTFDGDDGLETNQVTTQQALAGIGEGALTVSIHDERYTFFKNDDDAEQRLDIESDDNAEERSFPIEMPSLAEVGQYNLIDISLQMNKRGSKVKMYFDHKGKDLTCEEVSEFYAPQLTANGLEQNGISAELLDYGNEEFNYCVAQFIVPTALPVETVFSITGHLAQDDDSAIVEPIKANIEWTGIADTE